MEKGIEVIARYHYQQGYFVEVTTERSVLAGRDYWLCKKNSPRKVLNSKMKIRKCIRSLTRSKTMLKNMNIQICS